MRSPAVALLSILAIVGCRTPTDRLNDYDILYVPPFAVIPTSGAPESAGEEIAEYIMILAEEHETFPTVVGREEDIPETGKAVRVEGAVTFYQEKGQKLSRRVKWDSDEGGVRADVRFLDHETEMILDQQVFTGTPGTRTWRVEDGHPAFSRLAGWIVFRLHYQKSNKPCDLD